MGKVAVVAIGGNSLITDKQHQTVPDQYKAAAETCKHIASMIEKGWDVVITHGNGPQVGFILLRSEASRHLLHPVPLDSCGADTQGAIGYNLQQALGNEFAKRGIEKDVVTVVTRVLVDHKDKAFQEPSKPIGQFYSEDEAQSRVKSDGWVVKEDAGRGWRRVVASPVPLEIIELAAVETLLKAGFVVVAVGGGGIPVYREENGDIVGTAAVIDKDLASSLLASKIDADLFLISTAVKQVALHFGTPKEETVGRMTLAEAKKYLKEGHFKPGSMKPKIEAVISFLEKGGREALITSPDAIADALEGKTGTFITRE